jgi:hypothetical protein
MRLRVKDLDFDRGELIVRNGKDRRIGERSWRAALSRCFEATSKTDTTSGRYRSFWVCRREHDDE